MLESWLRDRAGPVIRYRTAVELAPFASEPGFLDARLGVDIAAHHSALLADPTVRRWLGNLCSYEELLDARRRGAGLGTGGTSSFLHGATDLNVEVAMPKLAQLGLRAGEPELDARTHSWRALLEAEIGRDYGDFLADDHAFLRKIYSVYDRQLIIASGLALLGYRDSAVLRVLNARLEAIYEALRVGPAATYDLHEEPGASISPRQWADQVLRSELYADGNIRLPFIHDICGFAALYPEWGEIERRKADTIISWVLAPEHQRLPYNYGYIRCPHGRGKSVGWRLNLPGYSGLSAAAFGAGLDPKALALSCWLLAVFQPAREHPWLKAALAHLSGFTTPRGTYLLPKGYLTEAAGRGYWVRGDRMGLGEDRRRPEWREIESTFWVLHLLRRAGSSASG